MYFVQLNWLQQETSIIAIYTFHETNSVEQSVSLF